MPELSLGARPNDLPSSLRRALELAKGKSLTAYTGSKYAA